MIDESSPLLARGSFSELRESDFPTDPHKQFCVLVGIPPSDLAKDAKVRIPATFLYERARNRRYAQNRTYILTASLSNLLLLAQIVFGATLTALGASESSHILITVFGVLNTIIAGLVAYLKSRGQPMRARMFRDDLEHVVTEIENSEIMWLGITKGAHGYDEIDIEDEVSVRSEVARLTRLYERAVKNSTQNNPDSYMVGSVLDAITGLRTRPGQEPTPGPSVPPAAVSSDAAGQAPAAVTQPAASTAPAAPDPDESPASAKPKPPKPADSGSKDTASDAPNGSSSATPAPPPAGASSAATKSGDKADEEPATASLSKDAVDASKQK